MEAGRRSGEVEDLATTVNVSVRVEARAEIDVGTATTTMTMNATMTESLLANLISFRHRTTVTTLVR